MDQTRTEMNASRLTATALIALVCASALTMAAPASAQEETASSSPAAALGTGLMKDGTLYARLLDVPPFVIGVVPPGPRPPILPVLYASFIGLEGIDGYSTSRGLERGAVESNPFVRWAVDNPATLWTIKGAAAAGSIYAAERLWKRHQRVRAVTVMVVSNAVMAAVAAKNFSAIHASR